ncbi:hypothetical protein ACF0H5_023794 [Mactra antiquata]
MEIHILANEDTATTSIMSSKFSSTDSIFHTAVPCIWHDSGCPVRNLLLDDGIGVEKLLDLTKNFRFVRPGISYNKDLQPHTLTSNLLSLMLLRLILISSITSLNKDVHLKFCISML